MDQPNHPGQTDQWSDPEEHIVGPLPPPPDSFPDRIGNYQIKRVLGEGRFGRVFLAEDLVGRSVAVKVCKATTPQQKTAFLGEARIWAQLERHQHIVPLLHVDEDKSLGPYIVSPRLK